MVQDQELKNFNDLWKVAQQLFNTSGRQTPHTPFSPRDLRLLPRRVHLKVGTPHGTLTIPVTAELEITLCHFSYPSVSVDPVQSSPAHFGVDYLKEEETSCVLYSSFSSQEPRSYASSIILVSYLDVGTEGVQASQHTVVQSRAES